MLVGKNNVGSIFKKFRIISALRLQSERPNPTIIILDEAEASMQDIPDRRLFSISTMIELNCLCPWSDMKADMKAPTKCPIIIKVRIVA
jgi:hypothetical protein